MHEIVVSYIYIEVQLAVRPLAALLIHSKITLHRISTSPGVLIGLVDLGVSRALKILPSQEYILGSRAALSRLGQLERITTT
jgi:hypothetical protein